MRVILNQINRLNYGFGNDSGLNNEDAWITFARDLKKADAQAPFCGFLHRYAEEDSV